MYLWTLQTDKITVNVTSNERPSINIEEIRMTDWDGKTIYLPNRSKPNPFTVNMKLTKEVSNWVNEEFYKFSKMDIFIQNSNEACTLRNALMTGINYDGINVEATFTYDALETMCLTNKTIHRTERYEITDDFI